MVKGLNYQYYQIYGTIMSQQYYILVIHFPF